MSDKVLRFLTRTWFYDRRRPIDGGGYVQTFIESGEEVPAEAVIWTSTDSGDEYVRRGYAEVVDTGRKAPKAGSEREG